MFEEELNEIFTDEEIVQFYEFNQSRNCTKLDFQNYWYVYDIQIFINTKLSDEGKSEVCSIAIEKFPQLVGIRKELL